MRIQTILVPIDFSDHCRAALDAAIDLAKEFDAQIHLLHCYQPYPTAVAPYGVVLPAQVETQMRAAAETQLGEWADKSRAAGIDVKVCVRAAFPCETIVSYAEEIGADLIAMGTRGLTGLKHALIGSTTERAVRMAPCPVLTVKAGG
jgi:nucleotide-binding universal stress UspA family protein